MIKFIMLLASCSMATFTGAKTLSAHEYANNYIETSEKVELKTTKKNYVSYDDEEYTITLTPYELNNYTLDNFYNLIDNDLSYEYLTLYYNTYTYVFDDNYSETYAVSYKNDDVENNDKILFIDNSEEYFFNEGIEVNNNSFNYNNEQIPSFNNTLTIEISSSYYTALKSAIEADIQANSANMPTISDLFGYVTNGVTSFVGSLGQAFTSVTALVWDSTNSQPTFIGLLMLCALGAGLIYLAFNLIRALIRRIRG